jgi:hypothetical protein
MTDDPEAAEDGTVDAARAFEALRAVEALPAAWAASRPPDTTPTLGGIVKGLAGVAGRLEAIERHPVLRLTPEQHRQALAQASGGLLRDTARELERAAQGMAYERRDDHPQDRSGGGGDPRVRGVRVRRGGRLLRDVPDRGRARPAAVF